MSAPARLPSERVELPGGIEIPATARNDFRGEFRQTRLADATRALHAAFVT